MIYDGKQRGQLFLHLRFVNNYVRLYLITQTRRIITKYLHKVSLG